MNIGDHLKLLSPQEWVHKFLQKGIRTDGRKFDEFRPAVIQSDAISTADGSSMVRQNGSLVIASIRCELGRPRQEDRGRIEILLQQSATKGTEIFGGEEIRLGQNELNFCTEVIQSLVENGSIVDLKDLCIEKGKICWILRCDVLILDGIPSVDACLTAVLTAFNSLTLPEIILKPIEKIEISQNVVDGFENDQMEDQEETDDLIFSPERIKVNLKNRRSVKICDSKPASSTFLFHRLNLDDKSENIDIGSSKILVLADPSCEEVTELGLDGKIGSVAIIVGEKGTILGIHATGSGSAIEEDTIDRCVNLAESRRRLINRLITEACTK